MAQAESSATPGESDTLEAAHAALRQRADIQFDLPRFVPPEPPETPGWLQALGRVLARVFETLAPLLQIFFWGLIALVVLGVVYLIAREAGWIRWSPPRRKGRRKGPAQTPYQPEAALARALLEDADALARQGRFEEAVHQLLLRSIDDMQRFRPRSVRPAATSRDLARLDILPDPARKAFSAMAGLVERSLFGGRPVGESGYQACREAYESFALPKVWS